MSRDAVPDLLSVPSRSPPFCSTSMSILEAVTCWIPEWRCAGCLFPGLGQCLVKIVPSLIPSTWKPAWG